MRRSPLLSVRFGLLAALLVPLAGSPAAPAPPTRCRCAQLSLDRYFDQADIVVAGRVRSLRRIPRTPGHPERIEVVIAPQFRPGPFKGSLADVQLTTSTTSASCGVDVQVGGVYLVFASREDSANPGLAWFNTCSGSRRYPGEPFLDLPANRILAHLAELADSATATATASQQPGPSSEFHTSPACWEQPRVYHQGTPSPDLRDRIRIGRDAVPLTDSGGIYSPNHGYRVWMPPPSPGTTGGASAWFLIDDEKPRPLRVQINGAIAPPAVQWVSEKLLFLRIVWGRVSFTDLLLDVELGRPIYQEQARYGDAAFAQYHAACLGQCPCLPVPGSADSLPAPPRHQPLSGEREHLARIQPENLAHLDQDWDGRIFSNAGGLRFTVSALKGQLGREEYPIRLHEVRDVSGVFWLQLSLYRVSPCSDRDAIPVHKGWVPAFSSRGRAVMAVAPGGC
jgi:hypothetical protein